MSCLDKDPASRPQSADQLIERLGACSESGTWTRQQAQRWWDAISPLSERHANVVQMMLGYELLEFRTRVDDEPADHGEP